MRLITIIACLAALALPAAAFAGDGAGGKGFDEHLARATAAVQKVTEGCKVATPKCAEAKARITARLTKWEARLQERIDRVGARPDGAKKQERLDALKKRLEAVKDLEAKLT